MAKTFYLQVNQSNGKITDVIDYPHGDYIPVELATPLHENYTPSILGGAWALQDGVPVYHSEWDIAPVGSVEERLDRQQEVIDTLLISNLKG